MAQQLDWDTIRQHYLARLAVARRRGLTQQAVAAAGQLSGQNAISKLIANRNLGPSVDTFAKAVAGLGLSLSAFFAELESRGRRPGELPPMATMDPVEQARMALEAARCEVHDLLARLARVEQALDDLGSTQAMKPRTARRRRARDVA